MSVIAREKTKGSGIWWLFINHHGRRKSKKIGTDRVEAVRLAKVLEGRLAAGDLGMDDFSKKKKVGTVKEYTHLWLTTTVPATLKLSTQSDYKSIVRTHISKASFYKTTVSSVTKGQIKRFLRSKLSAGLSHSTVTHIKNALGKIFAEAMDDEVIKNNPVHGIKLGSKKNDSRKPKITPLEVDEVNTLLNTFKTEKPHYYPLVLLLVNTGLRIGEAVALHWQDVNFDDREISINKNFTRNLLEDSTKNGKDRKVDMTAQLADCLKELKLSRAGEQIPRGTDWLFPSIIKTSDKPLNYDRWRIDIFYPMLEKAEVRKIRVHDLRHTYASIMISTGVGLVYIKDQLGHSSIKVTVDIYGHLLKGDGSTKPVDVLGDLLHPVAPQSHPETKKDLTKIG